MNETEGGERLGFEMNLRVGGETLGLKGAVPARPVELRELLPLLQAVDNALIDVRIREVQKEGKGISCRAGCGTCCCQMVPVAESEALALAALVEALPEPRRGLVRERFARAVAGLEAGGLLERVRASPALEKPEERRRIGLDYFALAIRCPFLEDQSCSIHQDRPLCCREYLVTSPAAKCAAPADDEVETVHIPVRLSKILYRLGEDAEEGPTRWMPLVLALEWAEGHRDLPQRTFPGPQLLDRLFQRIAKPPGPH